MTASRRRTLEEAGFQLACRTQDVPGNRPLAVELEGRGILVCRVLLGFAAIDAICPHRGASMANAEVRRGRVVCPVHLFEFDLASGACVEGSSPGTVVHELEVVGTAIYVRLSATPPTSALCTAEEA